MHPKAAALVQKYKDMGERLAAMQPTGQEYIKLAKDRAELAPFAEKYDELVNIDREIADNREMIAGSDDEEIKKMAREDIEKLETRKNELDKEILKMLLPKDELETRNVIVEIRAGTGGDEAALFAGDLFRMYSRYAELKRWKLEVMDFNDTGLGGYKEIVFSLKGKEVYSRMKLEAGFTGPDRDRKRRQDPHIDRFSGSSPRPPRSTSG